MLPKFVCPEHQVKHPGAAAGGGAAGGGASTPKDSQPEQQPKQQQEQPKEEAKATPAPKVGGQPAQQARPQPGGHTDEVITYGMRFNHLMTRDDTSDAVSSIQPAPRIGSKKPAEQARPQPGGHSHEVGGSSTMQYACLKHKCNSVINS